MITAGQIITAVIGLSSIDRTALDGAVASHLGNIQDDAAVAEDVLAILTPIFPEAGVIAEIIALLVALYPIAKALGVEVHPDTNPMQDAQTTRNFNPGDPAARL